MSGTWSANIVDLTHYATVNPLCVNIVDHLAGECLYKINYFYYYQSVVPLPFLPTHSSNQLQW